MITASLGSSRKFHELFDAAGEMGFFAQALFPLIVVNTDDFGRMEGDPFTVKFKVFPTCRCSEEQFDHVLRAMDKVGLIQRYTSQGRTYLQVWNFDEHQSGLHKRTRSKFPDPPSFPGDSGNLPVIPHEQNRTENEGNRTEAARALNRSEFPGNSRKSPYLFEVYLRYAEAQAGIKNPAAYATAIYKSGEADSLIASWLASGSVGNAPPKWKHHFGRQIKSLLRDLNGDPRRPLLEKAKSLIEASDYPGFCEVRERLNTEGIPLS